MAFSVGGFIFTASTGGDTFAQPARAVYPYRVLGLSVSLRSLPLDSKLSTNHSPYPVLAETGIWLGNADATDHVSFGGITVAVLHRAHAVVTPETRTEYSTSHITSTLPRLSQISAHRPQIPLCMHQAEHHTRMHHASTS